MAERAPISARRIHGREAWRVRGPYRVDGALRPAGDKSIAHRAVLFAALARGVSELRNVPDGEDVGRTLAAMRSLGVQIEPDSQAWRFAGAGLRALHPAPGGLDCGNSGTSMRLLCGLLAAQPFDSRLVGDASLSRRPMRRVAVPLAAMGAHIECEGTDGRPPIVVRRAGRALSGMTHRVGVDSAQVRTAILLAGLYATGPTRLEPAGSSRDHTERLLRACHVYLRRDARGLELFPTQGIGWNAFTMRIPGDVSSAAFWVALGLMPGARLRVDGVGLNPGRVRYLEILRAAGATLAFEVQGEELGEPWGVIRIRGGGRLRGIDLRGPDVVQCIDEIPALAAAALLAGAGFRVRDAAELRAKESDRIAAAVRLLVAFGGRVREFADGFSLEPAARLHAGRFDAGGDHRLAMSAAIVALAIDGESDIDDVGAVRTSYPAFTSDAGSLLVAL